MRLGKSSRLVVGLCASVVMFGAPAFAQNCFYPGNFDNGKNCGKYNNIKKKANKQCIKAGKAIYKVDKKIQRFERRKERLLENSQFKTVKMGKKAIQLIGKLAQGPCQDALDLTDLDNLDDLLINITVTVAANLVEALTGLDFTKPECIDQAILEKKIQKIADKLTNLWIKYEFKTDLLDERIEDAEASKGPKMEEEVCRCETIPALIDEEYALKCP